MPDTPILEILRDLMIDVFDIDDVSISETTTAADIEAWDSLHHIRLIIAVERKFKIKFKNAEVEGLKNVGDLIAKIHEKIAG